MKNSIKSVTLSSLIIGITLTSPLAFGGNDGWHEKIVVRCEMLDWKYDRTGETFDLVSSYKIESLEPFVEDGIVKEEKRYRKTIASGNYVQSIKGDTLLALFKEHNLVQGKFPDSGIAMFTTDGGPYPPGISVNLDQEQYGNVTFNGPVVEQLPVDLDRAWNSYAQEYMGRLLNRQGDYLNVFDREIKQGISHITIRKGAGDVEKHRFLCKLIKDESLVNHRKWDVYSDEADRVISSALGESHFVPEEAMPDLKRGENPKSRTRGTSTPESVSGSDGSKTVSQ